jgi:hypothetical protein
MDSFSHGFGIDVGVVAEASRRVGSMLRSGQSRMLMARGWNRHSQVTVPGLLGCLLVIVLAGFGSSARAGEAPPPYDTTAANLMVVLRESPGANKQDESLVRTGKGKTTLPDGREVEFDLAWFEYLGDMHIRFVFDTPTSLPHAAPADLERLGLTPETALELAVANIKRVYGEPYAVRWGAVMEVRGKLPDLFSSYFLDKAYWNRLLERHPEGIVALVAKRGGLLYAPLSNEQGVRFLRLNAVPLFTSSERLRVSSALYLFKDGAWRVFQAPAVQPVP